jgi:hypothetical protein
MIDVVMYDYSVLFKLTKGASRLYNKTCYIAKLYNLLEKRKKKCYITQCFITYILFYNMFYVIRQLSIKIKRCFKTLFYNMFRLVHTGQHVIETFLRRLRHSYKVFETTIALNFTC